MKPAFKAEQVGSFLRPQGVKDARAVLAAGKGTAAQLRAEEDAAILACLAHQKASGVDVFSDGEFRRNGFQNDFIDSVEGYEATDTPLRRIWKGPGAQPDAEATQVVVAQRLRQVRRLTADQTAFLKQHAPGPFKMTVPSPNQFPALGYLPGLTDRFYPMREDLLTHITQIIREEVTALADEGVTYIQVDAPRYSYFVDPEWREYLRSMGQDPDALLTAAVAADRAVFDGARREGITTAFHVCRGNNQSKWYAQGGYEPIAEELFNGLNVDRLLLEYDTERSGTFEPLRHVPDGMVVVLGLISTKTGELESRDEVLRRIDEAARFVPIERLALSPQCGFASMPAGNMLSEEQQWRKLELVVDVARQVWG